MISYGFTEPAGAALLDELRAFLTRFVAYPSDHAAVAVTLWSAHAHVLDCFESTPRLAFLSTEPGSAKTRSLEVVETLVPRPMFTLNASIAALFRKVSDPAGRPTVLIDEVDTIFGPRAAKEHEDLRAFVNGGHRRGAMATRCVVRGKTIEVEDFPCYAAVALAGLNDLPDTIMTRSVVIRMRRRAPYEHVEPYRHRIHASEGRALADRLAAWTAGIATVLQSTWPELPKGVEDRSADVWEPLVAIADQAGGDWPALARSAAVSFVTDARKGGETLGIRLLADLRTVFTSERMSTESILAALCAIDEAPWGDLRGKPLDARGLARRLAQYEVSPGTVRVDIDHTVKGYKREDLVDAWLRYLPSPPAATVTSVTPSQQAGEVPDVTDVTLPAQGEDSDEPEAASLEYEPSQADHPRLSVVQESQSDGLTPADTSGDVPGSGNPICSGCGKRNLFHRISIERGICAGCAKASEAAS